MFNQSRILTGSSARRSTCLALKDAKICGCMSPRATSIWLVQTPRVVPSGFQRERTTPSPFEPLLTTRSINFLNASSRGLTDRIAVLDTRASGPLASRIKWLAVENFSGINGDGTLNLHGFDVRADKDTDTLRIILINHRPPIDLISGEALDAKVVGANSTVEQFETTAGSNIMRHVTTYAHELIQTPNRVTWVDDDSFLYTNDHSAKVGFVSPTTCSIGVFTDLTSADT